MTTSGESEAITFASAASSQVDWPGWMRAMGVHVRRVREFLGLSQVQLAKAAGVSQGAVSRLEAGQGLATPFLAILKINLALARALRALDPSELADDVRQFLRHMEFFTPLPPQGRPPTVGGVPFEALQVTRDPELERIVQAYRSLPERRRKSLATVVMATADALVR